MNKVAHYLQQHLVGEVLTSDDVLDYFATDESIFSVRPLLVVHPRNENDLRKAARFSWQLAERGRVVPITMRGKGTDQTGASLGSGIILSTPAHMNKIIELDPKSGVVTVQAGTNAAKLQQTLHTHGRYIPSLNDTEEYMTIGGAVANNDSGRSSYKYGPIREHVTGMRVVLANGELIRTGRLSKRELNKKLGYASFEGQIYRELDKLIEEASDVITDLQKLGDRNNAGYALADVKLKDGSFDLTPLFVGSQSTLGLISEITLETQVHSPVRSLAICMFDSREDAREMVEKLNKMKNGPVSVDFVDGTVVDQVRAINPSLFKHTLGDDMPAMMLFISFEDKAGKNAKKIKKTLGKMCEQSNGEVIVPDDESLESWEVVRECVSYVLSANKGSARAVPLIDDAVVPVDKLAIFLDKAQALAEDGMSGKAAFWGQAGSGIVSAAAVFDIGQVGERQKMFRMLDAFYNLVAEVGGSVAGASAEGRLRGSQSYKVMTPETLELMNAVKKVFDPFNMLNPGVKTGVDIDRLKPLLRNSYILDHQHAHLPRS